MSLLNGSSALEKNQNKEDFKKKILKDINEIYLYRRNFESKMYIPILRCFAVIDFNKRDIGTIKEIVNIINNNWNTQTRIFKAKIIDIQSILKLWVKWE